MVWLDWLLHPFKSARRHNRRVAAGRVRAAGSSQQRDETYENLMRHLREVEHQIEHLNGKGRR